MVPQKKKSSLASQQTRFRLWFVLMIIISLPLWIGACGRGSQKAVVAEVNGQRITVKDVQNELARTPVDMRAVYAQKPEEVLNRLISLTLLLQEAKRKGLVDSADLRGLNTPSVQEGLRRFMEAEVQGIAEVTDKEVAAFYRQYRDQMGGKSLSQAREAIRRMILEQKQQQRIGDLVGRLRAKAAVTTYPERLPKPPPPALEASTANEFSEVLQNGRPTVVDFGSTRCIPCILLQPVLQAVKDERGRQINIIFMEVDEHKDLARRYRVQFVPTVIFFDAHGREVYRHVGFMDRKAIDKILHELRFLTG